MARKIVFEPVGWTSSERSARRPPEIMVDRERTMRLYGHIRRSRAATVEHGLSLQHGPPRNVGCAAMQACNLEQLERKIARLLLQATSLLRRAQSRKGYYIDIARVVAHMLLVMLPGALPWTLPGRRTS